jgi:hypothetical protein
MKFISVSVAGSEDDFRAIFVLMGTHKFFWQQNAAKGFIISGRA